MTATKNAIADSLKVQSYSTIYFEQTGWSKQQKLVDPFVDALTRTALWEHLPMYSAGAGQAKPRGDVSALKTALLKGKTQHSLFGGGGETMFSNDTTAILQIDVGAGAVEIMTLTKGAALEALGRRALDDFFELLCSLHDDLKGAAHVVRATAWTEWKESTSKNDDTSKWPLRAIADVVEPNRPKDEDVFWDAGHAIGAAPPPEGVTCKTHGDLVMLRWIDDPTDAAAADTTAVKHEAWIKKILTI